MDKTWLVPTIIDFILLDNPDFYHKFFVKSRYFEENENEAIVGFHACSQFSSTFHMKWQSNDFYIFWTVDQATSLGFPLDD